MNIDECNLIEKKMECIDPPNEINVDKDVAVTHKPDEEKVRKRRSRHKIDEEAYDLDHRLKWSRTRDESPDHGTKRSSPHRHHLSPRDGGRSSSRDGDKSIREYRDKIIKRRDGEVRNGRDRNRERNQNKEKIRERDRDKPRESYRDRYREREKDRDQERPHRSRSKQGRHGEERGREKSKDREHKERESEKDYRERAHDIRLHGDREEEILEEFDLKQDQSRPHKDRKEVIEEFDLKRDQSRPHKDGKEEIVIEVDPERDQRTVFAYQITPKANERDIFEFFSQAGKVRDVRLIMDRISKHSEGVGYVEFVDAMSVPMAIALSGQPLRGQPVMVQPSGAENNLAQSTSSTVGVINGVIGPYSGGARRLYIGNLHLNMKEDQLRQIFEPFGAVEMVELPTEPKTGNCKGFGFVQFSRLEDARAAECLNGQLEIVGHLIEVSTVTDQTLLEAEMIDGNLDDNEGGGFALNGNSRAILMQKIDRSGTWLSTNGSQPGPLIFGIMPEVPPVTVPSYDLIGVPSECLLLKNMLDPKIETEPDFELDIKEDVKEECSRFGALRHIHVDKVSAGFVYLRFEITEAAMSAQRALHGRWFAGKMITATFMVLQNYEAKFPDSR